MYVTMLVPRSKAGEVTRAFHKWGWVLTVDEGNGAHEAIMPENSTAMEELLRIAGAGMWPSLGAETAPGRRTWKPQVAKCRRR
jgi:hypothetical protein